MDKQHTNNIPSTDEEAWLRYPKINWLYNTTRLLDFQKINWYPFEVEGVTNTELGDFSIGNTLLPDGGQLFIEKHLTLVDWDNKDYAKMYRSKVDLIIHKGSLVHEVYYKENMDGDIIALGPQDSGELELKVSGLLAWHLNKFCGVISVEYINNIIIAIRLKPNDKAEEFYPHMVYKKLNALYTRRQWTRLPEIHTTT